MDPHFLTGTFEETTHTHTHEMDTEQTSGLGIPITRSSACSCSSCCCKISSCLCSSSSCRLMYSWRGRQQRMQRNTRGRGREKEPVISKVRRNCQVKCGRKEEKKTQTATGQAIQHLIITEGMIIKTITRNQILPVRVDTLKGLQTVNVGESQETIEPHYTVGGDGHCHHP